MLLSIHDGSVSRGTRVVLAHFDFSIRGKEKIALVGQNGAGKSTLLKVLHGQIDLDRDDHALSTGGGRIVQARTFTTGLLDQTLQVDPQRKLDEFVLSLAKGLPAERGRFYHLLKGFGIREEDREKRIGSFSGGEKKKIELAGLLFMRPDILLLDEPTNHLDFDSVGWLESAIRSFPNAVVCVSHDRWFLDRFSDTVWEVRGGRLFLYRGNYTAYREERERRHKKEEKKYVSDLQERKKEEDLIRRFRGKSRKDSFVRSRKKRLERMGTISAPLPEEAVLRDRPLIPARLGSKWVISCDHLTFGYEEGRPLHEIDVRVKRGKKIGILGANGTGKSAFLKTLAGLLPPLKGKCILGQTVDMAYFDQGTVDLIRGEGSVFSWYRDHFPSMTGKEIREELNGFLFRGQALSTHISALSGGEKARLSLAALLHTKPNLLLLDEPTNNMDIPAKETMESIFKAYTGTILFVSHDRYFLNELADSLLLFGKEGEIVHIYPFGYSHYLAHGRGKEEGGDLARTEEEERLISGLHSVPKAVHLPHALSERAEETDYAFRMNKEEREAKESAYEASLGGGEEEEKEAYLSLDDWLNAPDDEPSQEEKEKEEAALKEWTDSLVDWYDLWQDTPDGTKSMEEGEGSEGAGEGDDPVRPGG